MIWGYTHDFGNLHAEFWLILRSSTLLTWKDPDGPKDEEGPGAG